MCSPLKSDHYQEPIPWLDVTSDGSMVLSDAAVIAWARKQKVGGHLFLSVVGTGIHRLKTVVPTKLVHTDISVHVHRLLEINRPRILVDSAALNIEWLTDDSGSSVLSVSLVLSLGVPDKEALETMRIFKVDGDLVARLDSALLTDDASEVVNIQQTKQSTVDRA